MTSVSPIVRTPTDPTGDVYGWDWSATTHEADTREGPRGRPRDVDQLASALGSSLVVPGRGLQGWSQSVQCFDTGGYSLGHIYWGGGRDDLHVLATGEAANTVRPLVVAEGVRTARVDTRVDTLEPFEALEALCWQAAESYGTQITKVESWGGKTPGRTVYLGAPSSAIRVRIYEKWKQSPGEYVDGTNRVEVQLRPASNVKARVSTWGPEQTFCASKVTTKLARLLGQKVAAPGTLHVRKGTPTLEAALEAMAHQYGGTVARWLEYSGGDFAKVVDYMLWKQDRPTQDEVYQPGTNAPARKGPYDVYGLEGPLPA